MAGDCNPLESTDCDSNPGLSSSTYSWDFTSGANDDNWESVGGGDVNYTDSGAEFTIGEKGDSPTLQSSWYIFFGRVEVHMRAASGTGIVSCIVLLSDDYDEVDWEWLGGYPDEAQTNYFGKGDSSYSGRDTMESVEDAQNMSHNYTLYWTEESLTWYIDGTLARTLNYADASNGDKYPQTPSRVKLGIWAGGDSENSEGTISWARGETDYNEGPFTAIVESVDVTNFNPATKYTYSDQTGDYTSIEFDAVSSSDEGDDTFSTSSAGYFTATPAASFTSTSTESQAIYSIATGGSSEIDDTTSSDLTQSGRGSFVGTKNGKQSGRRMGSGY